MIFLLRPCMERSTLAVGCFFQSHLEVQSTMIKLHTLRRALILLSLLAALIGQASWATAGTLGGSAA